MSSSCTARIIQLRCVIWSLGACRGESIDNLSLASHQPLPTPAPFLEPILTRHRKRTRALPRDRLEFVLGPGWPHLAAPEDPELLLAVCIAAQLQELRPGNLRAGPRVHAPCWKRGVIDRPPA